MRKIRKTDLAIILALVITFVVIIVINSRLIIRSMVNQTEQVGQTQIGSIKTDFENYIASAENSLFRVAVGAEQLKDEDDDRAALEKYIISQKKTQLEITNGINFNVYVAGKGWQIIPDFDAPDDYHATERNWYVGAIDSAGDIFITDPYIDSMTGEMCFTMSVMLSDNETVVAMDFTLSEIQESIEKMSLSDGSVAMIVTQEGLIAGYSDMSFVGKDINKSLPDYVNVFMNVQQNNNDKSFIEKIAGTRNTVFHSVTQNNWYMILCVNNTELYREITKQIAVNFLINILMLVMIIVMYAFGIRNRIRSEEALEGRKVFVENILEKLKTPLNSIISISDWSSEEGIPTGEDIASIRTNGLRMNEIMNELSSYSSIVSNLEKNKREKREKDNDISRTIRIFRNIIVLLLLVVMIISSAFFYDAGTVGSVDMMSERLDEYYYQLNLWEKEQITTLNMFSDIIVSKPELIEDYDEAVKWLDSVAQNYEDISVCYLANPYSEHAIIMNNGWQPDEDWKVEEREWYKQTEKSEAPYSISSPYVDAQTGEYCITFSKVVYGKNGEFLGVFGIDFYMDKIIQIFGESYSKYEYVFLVDPNGDIINHPNKDYEMVGDSRTNITKTPYYDAFCDDRGRLFTFKDYDNIRRACVSKKDKNTGFSIILLWKWTEVYMLPILYTGIYVIITFVVILLIIILLNKVIRSQANMNQKLSEAVSKAEAAGKAKSDFLAQMSHEIRTPINAVIGMDEMILRESEDVNIKEYASDIKSASKTLLSLINGILDFSKIESGKMDIVSVEYDTAEMIDNLVNMISDRAEKKGLEFRLGIDEMLPRIMYGDDVRVRQVITNLLTNAVKYTEKGTVTLVMRNESVSGNECTLYVEVRDTGIGIKEEDMAKLFESFQRIEESRNRNIEGTGLGMSIVDGILKLMGSSLEISSEYGKGSSFSFRIVQNIVDATPLGEYKRHRDTEELRKRTMQMHIVDANILVVDDNEMNLKVARGLMKRLDTVPDLANGGKKAIEMIKEKHYDIIFMDHLMPDMDGIETLKAIRKASLLDESTAVIALTANAIAGAREMYISEGFKDYLSKPIDPDALEKTLREYLPEGSYTCYESINGEGMIVQESQKIKSYTFVEVNKEAYAKQPAVSETSEKSHSENEVLEKLREKGFNVEEGLGYAMEDPEFYKELIVTFIESSKDKRNLIRTHYSDRNWSDYKIQVHALKSAARTIGADTLSEMALEQENASKECDENVIDKGYEPLMAKYEQVVNDLVEILGIDSDDTGKTSDDDDDEIMEFFPE